MIPSPNVYHVQAGDDDDTCNAYVIADSFADAVRQWQRWVRADQELDSLYLPVGEPEQVTKLSEVGETPLIFSRPATTREPAPPEQAEPRPAPKPARRPVEFLVAYNDRTWDTFTKEVPGNVPDEKLTEWAASNLFTHPADRNLNIVLYAVYWIGESVEDQE